MSSPPQFEAPSPEELHELLPAYDVLAFIAKGGMGAVYKAHQKSLERDVAIKILPREFGEDEEFRKRFEDEAKAMARLNHPNLISVYDFGEVDHMPYIVMEFVDGKSLHYSAHGKAIEQNEVARLVTGICEGLAHAHEAGILHRDIKPANILLDAKKRPKIGDFGLARVADENEGDGVIYGTPDYTAPEIVKKPSAVDTRSDVFSTGVILYELLTGKLPEKTYIPASQVEDVDPRFDKIVRRATHPSPMLRFADGEAMAKDLKQLSEALEKQPSGIMATPPAPTPSPPPEAAAPATPITSPAPPPAVMDTPLPDPGAAAVPETPEVQIKLGTNWSLLRNLVIIVLLLAAIFGMYRAYQWQKSENARKQEEQRKINDAEQAARRAEDERSRKEVEERARKARERLDALKNAAPVTPEPEPETPLEALERLKPQLISGEERTEFPPGTLIRGESHFFLLNKPLSWQRASAYAEEYGGHLATCLNEGEQNWLSSKIPSSTTIWLGGGSTGRTAWGWVDGSPWTVRTPSSSTGNCATLSDLGSIRAQSGGKKFPFFIQWRNDGSNPGTLETQITRLKASLDTPERVYPPGVRLFENRSYLLIEKTGTWEEANKMAKTAHGHLAVPSEPSENNYLDQLVNNSLDPDASAWIGGRHNGLSWTWITGETWAFASWAPESPDGDKAVDTAVRLVAGDPGGWDDEAPDDGEATSAFIIEWSEDRENTRPVASAPGSGSWANLRTTAQKNIQVLEAKFAEKLLENGKGLKSDLNFWLRGLRDNDERLYSPVVSRIKSRVKASGSIDLAMAEIRKITLSPRGVDILRTRLQGQQDLRDSLEATANRLRVNYVQNLEAKKDAAEDGGKPNQVRAIQNEINACGESGKTFLNHLGSGFLSAPAPAGEAP